MKKHWRLRVVALPALVVGALAIGACGDDDDEPEKVAIEATGNGQQVKYTAPSEVQAGPVELEFTNSTQKESDAQLIKIEGEYTEDQVIDELGKAVEGQAVAEWFKAAGGAGTTGPGETNTATQELEAGTYYIVGQDRPQTPLTTFTVTEDGGGEVEEPDAKVTAQEYSFSGEGLKSGQQEILLDNAGAQWHHFIAAPIAEGRTLEDVKAFAGPGQPPQGPPPIDQEGGFESTVLEGGTSQVISADLKPGKWAFLCFISDKQGGPPHVAKGMISEVTVED
jgi:hypothetical protein